jgi:hypothetical protein
MARPIGVKSDFKTESVENGAPNRNTCVFNFYILLKLALLFPYSTEAGALSLKCNKILKSLKQTVPYSLGHKFAKFAFQQSMNYFSVMFTILLIKSKYFSH